MHISTKDVFLDCKVMYQNENFKYINAFLKYTKNDMISFVLIDKNDSIDLHLLENYNNNLPFVHLTNNHNC